MMTKAYLAVLSTGILTRLFLNVPALSAEHY